MSTGDFPRPQPCPNCGYCPHCGRSNLQPYWPHWPYRWTQPTWWYNTTGGTTATSGYVNVQVPEPCNHGDHTQ